MASMWRDDYPTGRGPLGFFLYASRPHWKFAIFAIVMASLGNVFNASAAYVFKLITNAATALKSGGSFDDLFWYCSASIIVLALAKIFWTISGFSAARWATGAQATARYALTSYVTLHSRAYFSDRFAGSLMTKIRHAAAGVRESVDLFLWEFLELGISAIASFVIAFTANALLAFIFLAWVIVIFVVNVFLVRKRIPLSMRAHALESAINGATVDLLSNVSAMQEYARREFEIERLKGATNDRRLAGLRNWNFGESIRAINRAILVVFGGAMVFTSITLAKAGTISVGDIVLVITIIFRIEGLLQSLGSNLNRFAETWGEIQESLEEIVEPHEIPDRPGAKDLIVREGDIRLEHVTFSYLEATVFKDLSLHIPPAQRVGLVGKSGAGKSTLIRLLLHHHDIESGAIKVDGTNIADVTQESLRNAISVVPQEPLLFHRTVAENIAYGNPNASREEIMQAAKLAHAHDFIERIPEGYEAMVGERGVKLSGGERQRIAIARAILKNAPILLLDEATSALDSESEVAIQTALHTLMQGKTVVAIAHRLSTLREMDRIIVLDDGKVVEDGTHDSLLGNHGIYSELWNHQAGGFIPRS